MRRHLPMVLPLLALACGADSGSMLDGGEASTSGSTSDTTGTDTETDPTGATIGGTMTSSGETSEPECTGEEMCPAEAPFCGATRECVTCDAMPMPDMACAEASAEEPLCVGGACVACTPENPIVCDDQFLLCDAATNVCIQCTEHAQCGSGACELAVGRCFPDDLVLQVDGDDEELPSQQASAVNAAVQAVAAGAFAVIVVHELDGGGIYGPVLIDGGKTIALLAALGESPIVQGAGGNPAIRVEGASTALYMDRMRVTNANAGGMRVDGAVAWLDRSRIVQNSGGGIVAQNGAELTVRNCFVGRNGDDFADTRGVTATNAILSVLYSTIAANDGTGASGPISVACDAASTGTVRNSIIAAATDTIECANVSFSFSVVDTNLLMGSDNTVLTFQPAWFPDIALSDFHISMGPPFANIAQWNMGDPPTDIDGDPRPAIDGTLDYAGADVP